jgi:MFS family permease
MNRPGAVTSERTGDEQRDAGLNHRERRLLVLLGAPSFALSLAVTTVSALAPVLLQEFTSAAITGLLIGAEGIFALFIPTLVGSRSDRLRTRLGGRLPFLLVSAPVGALALVLLPLSGSVAPTVILLLLFYAAYFTYFSPYFALYPDLVPDRLRGRSQGAAGAFRAVGLALALVGGASLLGLWRPLPFLLAAAVLLGVTAVFVRGARAALARREARAGTAAAGGGRGDAAAGWRLLREDPGIRNLMIATSLWETALSALRAFAVLYITVGLGRSLGSASLAFGGVAVAALVAALVAGSLADRWGHTRLIRIALVIYAAGTVVPLLTQSVLLLISVPLIAFAAATVMTLPYSLLMGLLQERDHGAAAGLYGLSRGVGLLAGPLLAGAAVSLLSGVFVDTEGYAAIFPVAGLAILASLPLLPGVARARAERAGGAA